MTEPGAAVLPTVLDDAAFEQLVRDCAPRLVRTARLLVGDDGLAQDLVQVALSVVWDKRATLVDPLAAEGYARTVMARRAAARWRRRWNGEEPTDVLPEVEAAGSDHATVVAVRSALATLPRRDRAVLVLRYFEDLSVEDTAAALGCAEITVKTAARRGLDRLRALDWEGFDL